MNPKIKLQIAPCCCKPYKSQGIRSTFDKQWGALRGPHFVFNWDGIPWTLQGLQQKGAIWSFIIGSSSLSNYWDVGSKFKNNIKNLKKIHNRGPLKGPRGALLFLQEQDRRKIKPMGSARGAGRVSHRMSHHSSSTRAATRPMFEVHLRDYYEND